MPAEPEDLLELNQKLLIEYHRGRLTGQQYQAILQLAYEFGPLTDVQIRRAVDNVLGGATDSSENYMACVIVNRKLSEGLKEEGISGRDYVNSLERTSRKIPKDEPPFWEKLPEQENAPVGATA
jgi:hypothetical protein